VQPVHEFLNRLRWDPAFAGGGFSLAYLDHREKEPVVVPFSAVTFDAGSSRMIGIVDPDGEVRKIPMHRIRRVYKDGAVVWERPAPPAPSSAT